MRLFDLDPNNPVRVLMEGPLDMNNPIDRELQKTATDAAKDGSMDPNDIAAQNDPMAQPGGDPLNDPMSGPQNAPDPAMGGDMADGPVEPEKPVDSALLARVQGHNYIQDYDHSNDDSPSHPISILSLEAGELSDLRKRIRVHLDRTGLEDRVGSYANPETKSAQDMLAFVDLIMMHKKQAVKDTNGGRSKKPRVQNQKPSKTKPGQKFKAKRN